MPGATVLEARKRGAGGARLAVAAALGAAVWVTTVILVASSEQPGNRGLLTVVLAFAIAVPLGVGIWAWHESRNVWTGRALVGAAVLFALASLAQSHLAVLYSLGRVSFWFVEPAIALLVLTFPSGRFKTKLERASFWMLTAIAALLYLPTAFLVERYPVPTPYASCSADCPQNAFMLLDSEPRFVHAVVYPVREIAAALALFAIAALLSRRALAATPVTRRTLTPLVALTTLFALSFAAFLAARRASPTSTAVDVLGWLHIMTLPGIGLAVLAGLLGSKFFEGVALERLAFRLRDHPEAEELQRVLAEVLDDPSLEIVYRGRDSWVDAAGRPVAAPGETPTRCVTEVLSGERPIAALIYDSALSDQRDFMAAAGSFALASLENTRLAAEVEVSLEELQDSRARIQAAADDERLRIERDLHDGAQQRLVALRLRLELAAQLTQEDPRRGSLLLVDLGHELEEALEEVRAIGRGIYPSLLADQGLVEALRSAARRAPLPATVEAQGISRYPTEIESAVYFCCLEALQNVGKHAAGATSIWISLVDDGFLRFGVVDDGAGMPEGDIPTGAGIANMRDRMAAVGGSVTIRSVRGQGTHVIGQVPLSERVPRFRSEQSR